MRMKRQCLTDSKFIAEHLLVEQSLPNDESHHYSIVQKNRKLLPYCNDLGWLIMSESD